jgi:tetratricopeptide (TPR) repeat protein
MFTGRIHDQLKASFGAGSVFRDMYNIPAGSDFRSVINEAVGHLAFGQFDVAAKEADTVLAVMPNYAEMYLIKGLSYCNIDENEKAEEAYSAGLKVDPTFSVLHLLRAEVRGKLGDVTGAQEDLSIVAQSDIRENLKPYIEAAQSGQFSCKDMMANK